MKFLRNYNALQVYMVLFFSHFCKYFAALFPYYWFYRQNLKKKPPLARVSQNLLQHQKSHGLHPALAEFRLCLVYLLLFACFVIWSCWYACECMLLCACHCHLTGCFAQQTAVALQHCRHHSHKGQFAPWLFVVVCFFHWLILLVCMLMHVALHMQLSSDWFFFIHNVLSTTASFHFDCCLVTADACDAAAAWSSFAAILVSSSGEKLHIQQFTQNI